MGVAKYHELVSIDANVTLASISACPRQTQLLDLLCADSKFEKFQHQHPEGLNLSPSKPPMAGAAETCTILDRTEVIVVSAVPYQLLMKHSQHTEHVQDYVRDIQIDRCDN